MNSPFKVLMYNTYINLSFAISTSLEGKSVIIVDSSDTHVFDYKTEFEAAKCFAMIEKAMNPRVVDKINWTRFHADVLLKDLEWFKSQIRLIEEDKEDYLLQFEEDTSFSPFEGIKKW